MAPGNQSEVWFEHQTAEGKSYYSNPKTKQTTWERPTDVQIISPPSPAGTVPCVQYLHVPMPVYMYCN